MNLMKKDTPPLNPLPQGEGKRALPPFDKGGRGDRVITVPTCREGKSTKNRPERTLARPSPHNISYAKLHINKQVTASKFRFRTFFLT